MPMPRSSPRRWRSWSSWTPSYLASTGGRRSTTIPQSGTSVSTGRHRKPWCRDASGFTSSTSGTTSRPTKRAPFLKPTEKLTPRPTPDPDACAPAGPTSFSFQQAAKDFAQLSQTKLTMPVLSIGGEKSLGDALAQQMKLGATNVTVIVLEETENSSLEENHKA